MAKSTTKDTLDEFDLDKIKRFTQTELAKLANSPQPFCYQIGTDTVIVGKYKVVKKDNKTWQVYQESQWIFDFFTRKHAIFHCLALHKHDYKIANEIKQADEQLGRLEFEAILYRQRYKKALAQQNDWDAERYSNRYLETMTKIADTKKQLQNSINSAKYIKV